MRAADAAPTARVIALYLSVCQGKSPGANETLRQAGNSEMIKNTDATHDNIYQRTKRRRRMIMRMRMMMMMLNEQKKKEGEGAGEREGRRKNRTRR